jgi:hypothetical protein
MSEQVDKLASEQVGQGIRPAGLGVNCDCWYKNPKPDGPYLVRCKKRATRLLSCTDTTGSYQLKRCDEHAGEIRGLAERGRVEILAEVEL